MAPQTRPETTKHSRPQQKPNLRNNHQQLSLHQNRDKVTSSSGKHIVIIKDDSRSRALLQEIFDLLEAPDRYTTLRDAEEALSWLNQFAQEGTDPAPDAILVDLELPGQQSAPLIMAVRSIPAYQHTQIYLVASSRLPGEQLQSIAQSCKPDHVILRPRHGISGLNHLVRELLSLANRPGPIR